MPIRTIASLVIAIVIGLVAVVMLRGYMSARAPTTSAQTAGVPVVVASSAVERGVTLDAKMLKVVTYPKDSVPVGAFASIAQIAGPGVAQHQAMRSFGVGEPILAARITGSGAKTNLSGSLTEGMRAIGVRSSDIAGVGGFVLPGDRVDVFVTRTIGSGDEAVTVTQTLAENCRVMGVDQVSDVETDKPIVAKAVTLEVTPDQAQTISLAQSVGAVTLSLRQAADAAPLARRATTAADLGLFGFHKKASGGGASTGASAKPKPKIGPGMNEVHVVRGVEATSYAVAGR